MNKDRFGELDALRGIAAFLVMIAHYTEHYRLLYGHNFSPRYDIFFGYYGVHLFFMISGFVIIVTASNVRNSKEFIIKRFARLYPVFWIAMTITFIITRLYDLPGRIVSLKNYFLNLTMVPKLLGGLPVDGAYWTLACEILFYALVALIIATGNLKRLTAICCVWLSLIYIDYFFKLPSTLNTYLNLPYGNYFIAGILFYKLKNSTINSKLGYALLAATYVIALLHDGKLIGATMISILYLLFFLFIKGRLSFIKIPVLIFLGSISYTLYLVHQNIGYVIIHALKIRFPELSTSVLIILPSVIVALLIAYLLHKFFELTLQKMIIKALLPQKSKKPVTSQESASIQTA